MSYHHVLIFLSLILLSSVVHARFLAEKLETKQGNGNKEGNHDDHGHGKEIIRGGETLVVESNSNKDKKEFGEMKDLPPFPGIPGYPPFPPMIPGFPLPPPLPDIPIFKPPFGNIPGIPPLPPIPNFPPLPPLPNIPIPFLSPPPA